MDTDQRADSNADGCGLSNHGHQVGHNHNSTHPEVKPCRTSHVIADGKSGGGDKEIRHGIRDAAPPRMNSARVLKQRFFCLSPHLLQLALLGYLWPRWISLSGKVAVSSISQTREPLNSSAPIRESDQNPSEVSVQRISVLRIESLNMAQKISVQRLKVAMSSTEFISAHRGYG